MPQLTGAQPKCGDTDSELGTSVHQGEPVKDSDTSRAVNLLRCQTTWKSYDFLRNSRHYRTPWNVNSSNSTLWTRKLLLAENKTTLHNMKHRTLNVYERGNPGEFSMRYPTTIHCSFHFHFIIKQVIRLTKNLGKNYGRRKLR